MRTRYLGGELIPYPQNFCERLRKFMSESGYPSSLISRLFTPDRRGNVPSDQLCAKMIVGNRGKKIGSNIVRNLERIMGDYYGGKGVDPHLGIPRRPLNDVAPPSAIAPPPPVNEVFDIPLFDDAPAPVSVKEGSVRECWKMCEELLGELSEAEARRVVSLLNILYEPS